MSTLAVKRWFLLGATLGLAGLFGFSAPGGVSGAASDSRSHAPVTQEQAATPMKPGEKQSNHLVGQKSPYLLQHADNPVNWYPWGKDAFDEARWRDKPIFLSIGYSTCHWCHVMERESFENPEIASILNEYFISIKVDREEHVAVDNLYMQAVIQMTGQGGWPLSVFLTPELKPFYGGTYFPPEDRWGQPGFKSVLLGVVRAWSNKREEMVRTGESLTQALRAAQRGSVSGDSSLGPKTMTTAFQMYETTYDETHGGFNPAPKFPRAHNLSFLLRYWKKTQDAKALAMVEGTLQAMAAGGIWDHVGGGFHRYSTDAQWFVPHFEKMLYDQAILAKAYLEAYQATGKELYAQVAREIFVYLLREMTLPEGAFYSAEDADSVIDPAQPKEKGEGAFYVWKADELEELLGTDRSKSFEALYGIQTNGNVHHDPLGEFRGKNILYQAQSEAEVAKATGRSRGEIRSLIQESKNLLFEARGRRPRPHLDDKILVDWNGLMISSLAFGSRVLGEPRYAQVAEQAAQFILQKLIREDGRLLHRYRDGEAALLGSLEDYAFFIHGLIDLYEATFKVIYLTQAKRLTHEMVRLFWDDEKGGFFLSGEDAEKLLFRQKELYDGAIPSGNSVAALDLLRVGRLTADKGLEEKADRLLKGFAGQVTQNPSAYSQLLIALDFALGPSNEIVIAGSAEETDTTQMLRTIYQRFLPNKVVVLHPTGEAGREVERLVPFIKDQVSIDGKATAYVCRNYACKLPTNNLQKLEELLK